VFNSKNVFHFLFLVFHISMQNKSILLRVDKKIHEWRKRRKVEG